MKEEDIKELAELYQSYLNVVVEQLDALEKEGDRNKQIEAMKAIAKDIIYLEENIEKDKKQIAEMPSSLHKRKVEAFYSDRVGNLFQNNLNREKVRALKYQENLLKEINVDKSKSDLTKLSTSTSKVDGMYQTAAGRETPFAKDYLANVGKLREHLYTLLALKEFSNQQSNLAQAVGRLKDSFLQYIDQATLESRQGVSRFEESEIERGMAEFAREQKSNPDPNALAMRNLKMLELIMQQRLQASANLHRLLQQVALVNAERLIVYTPFNVLEDEGLPQLIASFQKQASMIIEEDTALLESTLAVYEFLQQTLSLQIDEESAEKYQEKVNEFVKKLKSDNERLKLAYAECKKNLEAFPSMYEKALRKIYSNLKDKPQRDLDTNAKALAELRKMRATNLLNQTHMLKLLSTVPSIAFAYAKRNRAISHMAKREPESLFNLPEQLGPTLKMVITGNQAALTTMLEWAHAYQMLLQEKVGHYYASKPEMVNLEECIRALNQKQTNFEENALQILEEINEITARFQGRALGEEFNLYPEAALLNEKLHTLKQLLQDFDEKAKELSASLKEDIKSHQAVIDKFSESDKALCLKHNSVLQLQFNILSTRETILRDNLARQVATLEQGLQLVTTPIAQKQERVAPLVTSYRGAEQGKNKVELETSSDRNKKRQTP